MSLRLRLALIFIVGSLSTLFIATGYLYFTFSREINTSNKHLLTDKLQDVAAVLSLHPGDQAALEEEILEETSVQAQILVRVMKDGKSTVESRGMSKMLPSDRFIDLPRIKVGDSHFLIEARREGPYLIQGALDVTESIRIVRTYRQRLIYTLLLGAAGCSFFGVWAAQRGLKPLRAIAESARGIKAHHLEQRLDQGQFPQELLSLVQALNSMLDSLDHAFTRLSRFSAELAHELRTPITNLTGEAEILLSKDRPIEEYRLVVESSLEEYRRLSRLISRMLFLARSDDPSTTISSIPIETEVLLGEVLAFFEAVAEEQKVRLAGEAAGVIKGDPDMLRQALANLISNALAATPEGGEVFVTVKEQDHQALLEVRDNGRGIPSEELPNVFDRFYRTTEALKRKSPGTGLGLAIVQSIALLHGGDVSILSELGEGTTVALKFHC